MNRLLLCVIICFAAVLASCTAEQKANDTSAIDLSKKVPGDSTIYGLACDGCSDSVIVFLPNEGGDPVKYDIVNATKQHRVYGDPEVGDWVALVLDPKNKKVATMVIDLDQLKGTWTYQVLPRIKPSKTKTIAQIEAELTDSMREILFVPREYGFTLMRHQQAREVGRVITGNTLSDETIVEYPQVYPLTGWSIFNGRLVLKGDTTDMRHKRLRDNQVRRDTCEFVYMLGDSLALNYLSHGVRTLVGFHRQVNGFVANKKAREAAAKQQKADSIK